jgi:hypothetical protein
MPEIIFPGAPGDPQEGALVTEAQRQKLADLPTNAELNAGLEGKADRVAGKVPVDQLPEVVEGGSSGLMTGAQAADLEAVKNATSGTDLSYIPETRTISSSSGSGATLAEAAPNSVTGLMTGEQASKLEGIEEGANNYSLPVATASTIGGIRPGAGLVLDPVTGVVSAEPVPGTGTDLSFTASTGELASSSGNNATIPAAGGANAFGLMTGARADKLDALPTNASLNTSLAAKADTASTVSITGGTIVGYVESSNVNVALPLIGGQPAPLVIFRNPLGQVLEYANARPWDLQIDLSNSDLRLSFSAETTAYLQAREDAEIAAGVTGAMDYRIWNAIGTLRDEALDIFTGPSVTFTYGYGARAKAASLIPMFGVSPLFDSLEEGTHFVANGQWRGTSEAGTRRYINTGVITSSFTSTDFMMGCFRTQLPPSIVNAQHLMGCQNTTTAINGVQIAQVSPTAMRYRCLSSQTAEIPSGESLGIHAVRRVNAEGYSVIYDETIFPQVSAINPVPVPNRYLTVLAIMSGATGTAEAPGVAPEYLTGAVNTPSLSSLCAYFVGPGTSTTDENLVALQPLIETANTAIDNAVSNPL